MILGELVVERGFKLRQEHVIKVDRLILLEENNKRLFNKIVALERSSHSKDQKLAKMNQMLAEKNQMLAEKNQILSEKDKLLYEMSEQLSENIKQLEENDEQLACKDNTFRMFKTMYKGVQQNFKRHLLEQSQASKSRSGENKEKSKNRQKLVKKHLNAQIKGTTRRGRKMERGRRNEKRLDNFGKLFFTWYWAR